MPNATVNIGETTTLELKSLPGGEVVLKKMSYGETLQRRAILKLTLEMSGKGKSADIKGELAMASEAVNQFEFAHCIVDHNLEDDAGRKLNLNSAQDLARLDPRVGQEIEKKISDMNNFEEDDDSGE